MTVSTPFTAPASPPDTGASMNPRPCSAATAASSRATSADAVVWSTNTVPVLIPSKAPPAPTVTERTSSSLPTHANTIPFPAAASAGVAALLPPNSSVHRAAFDPVRLYTVTS